MRSNTKMERNVRAYLNAIIVMLCKFCMIRMIMTFSIKVCYLTVILPSQFLGGTVGAFNQLK